MTRKTYRTAQGKQIDLGALQLRNENIRAVGNMSVNARGDLIDSWNQPIESRNRVVKKSYDNQVSNVRDEPLFKSPPAAESKKPMKKTKPVVSTQPVAIPEPPEDFDEDFEKPAVKPQESGQESGGLAAAIARARKIRQETVQPPADMARNQPGVKRI